MCNMATRAEAYSAIDSERDYQDNLARNTVKYQSPMEQLALIRRIARDMEDAWYDQPGHPPMDYMRKIAGVAVRAMEVHGAPMRVPTPSCSESLSEVVRKGGLATTAGILHNSTLSAPYGDPHNAVGQADGDPYSTINSQMKMLLVVFAILNVFCAISEISRGMYWLVPWNIFAAFLCGRSAWRI